MKLTIQPDSRTLAMQPGETVLQAVRLAGIHLEASCAGKGTCGRCRVQILQGERTVPNEDEVERFSEAELAAGWRLACRLVPSGDLVVGRPDADGHTDRKKDLLWLPEWFHPEASHIETAAGAGSRNGQGVAFDIGTTTVVGVLWDLSTGEMLDAAARTNPQTAYGADVISRILFTMQEDDNRHILKKKIVDCLDDILGEFAGRATLDSDRLGEVTVVGNTTMTHLLLGVDPASLAAAPYLPGYTGPVTTDGQALGLATAPKAAIFVLPNIAGHVGADLVGVLLASDLKALDGANLAIDIGTNGEILLAKDGRVLTCSTAAGPAFEGASIRHGMRAAAGAIERVRFLDEEVAIRTIGDAEPVGICGSGLIDAVAELISSGLLTATGRFLRADEAVKSGVPVGLADRLKTTDGTAFLLYKGPDGREITVTQKDVREVQLAKAAIAAGIAILLAEMDLGVEDLSRILIAGAFGNYIDTDSALTIGLLPPVPPSKVQSIGNGAGAGASMALLSPPLRLEAGRMAEETIHIDLAVHKDFQTIYLNEMYFGNGAKRRQTK